MPSSRANPCPVCDRTKDSDCRISADGDRVICHHAKDLKPGEVVNGYAFTGNTSDDRAGHFTLDKPREGTARLPRSVCTARRKPAPRPPAPAPLPDQITLARLPEPFPAAPPDHFPQGHRIAYSDTQWTQWEDGTRTGRDGQIKSKGERPRHRDASGETVYSASDPWPLFGAELLHHAQGQWISAAEGPKCAQWLQAGGLVAVSQPGHDHKDASIRRRFEELQAAGVAGMAYLSDHDDTGRKKAAQLALEAAAVGFPFLHLPAAAVWPGIPDKGSIDDAPGDADDRVAAVEAAAQRLLTQHQLEAQALEGTPEPMGLDPSYEAGSRPVDLQAADILHDDAQGHIACVAGTLFRYAETTGCWETWSDADAIRQAQSVLRQMYRIKVDSSGRPWPEFSFGAYRQCRDAIASLKVKVGPGPLRGLKPPMVIVFSNGTYDLRTGALGPHSPDHGATYRINAPHVAGAECPAPLRRVIDTCYPEGAEPIIRAYVRWLVDPTIRYGEAFGFVGETGTGKGLLIEFGGSLIPPASRSSLGHPSDISGPEKLHQYVLGRRLIQFPDAPVHLPNSGHCGAFYELVENKPQSTRKLHAGEAGEARPMYARCVLGSIAPLQMREGRDGFLRRLLTLSTRLREGDMDASLRGDLVGDTGDHLLIRGQIVSWALEMPLPDVTSVLDGNDPEGLLRDAAAEAAIASDTVSRFADACLVPHILGHNAEVDDIALGQMFEAYVGWCRHAGVQHGMQLDNFQGQLRRALGAGRCLPRRKEPREDAKRAGRLPSQRLNLPRLDAGFQLRPGVLRNQQDGPQPRLGDRTTFDRLRLGSGGLTAIKALPPAARKWIAPDQRCETGPPETTSQGRNSAQPSPMPRAEDSDDRAGTTAQSQGLTQGSLRAVSAQSPSLKSKATTEELPSFSRWSHTSLSSNSNNRERGVINAAQHPLPHTAGITSPIGMRPALALPLPPFEEGALVEPTTPSSPLDPHDEQQQEPPVAPGPVFRFSQSAINARASAPPEPATRTTTGWVELALEHLKLGPRAAYTQQVVAWLSQHGAPAIGEPAVRAALLRLQLEDQADEDTLPLPAG
ncbi:hypothetical protein [Synechococcus sp. EJ6-Ellesmere]|uniref:hypothetical protein n=1 Tax=Synechococcus sp. EJ6-Ellesmere TaxID=2823734 RepID=UPI0020CEF8D9|nr:hypothetical protein [Synechococcus sp. EJ6-Ellesmere]MCP9823904.1 hypothetical protein [Synechococcus sp. EJ6-Ellesmere]